MEPVRASYRASRVRDYALPLAALAAGTTFPLMAVVMLYVVTGQAHFFMGYLYQFRANKMNYVYVASAVVLAVLAYLYFTFSGALLPLVMLVGVLFSAHFAHDEILLHGETRTPAKLITVAGFTLYFSALVSSFIFPALTPYAPYALIIPVLAAIVRFFIDRTPPASSERYLWIVELVIFLVAFLSGNPGGVLGVIVLLHVANWYVGVGGRVAGNSARARTYWFEVTASLLVLSVLFALYVYGHAPALAFLFKVQYYYAWAIAHIVLSFAASLPRRVPVSVV